MIEKIGEPVEEKDEKESILIVDDDESILKSLALILEKKGYEPETAVTGREAIEKVRERFFNLAFLDIRLSDMEGVELLAPFKELHPEMVVIIVTGYASLETAVRALNEGAAAYITKPLNMDEVLITVREGLEKQHLARENKRLYQEAQRELAERKRAEEEKKKLEAQFQQAQKMEALGTLAGGIAHDFNNLLTGIQGNVSLMLYDTDLSHLHHEKLKSIEEMVQSGAQLTRQLLGFSRRGKYHVKPSDINELIGKCLELFGRTRKEITIHTKYQKGIWPVEVDRGQIEQVLLNLFVNAWQAMPGEGKLYLETENVTLTETYIKPYQVNSGRYVKISVTDTGVGIDKKIQQRIFDPFFTTKEMGRGTGLGLASAYGIVKNHGGIINVYSEKGKGTTFTVYLPTSDKKVREEKVLPEEILEGSETILLVDDEDFIITVGSRTLKKLGYEVLTASSGKAAIDVYKAKKNKIDMVILDMIMPEMGGGDTYDRMKEINPAVKVLLSSGYSVDGQAEEILERGCHGFIQKPFNMKGLSQKIREILDKA